MAIYLSSNRLPLLALMGGVVSLGLLFGLLSWGSGHLEHQYEASLLASYIADNYMPDQHEASGIWPTNLAKLSQYLKTQRADPENSIIFYRLDLMQKYQRDRILKFRIMRSNQESCLFRIETKDANIECQSSSKDAGSCRVLR